MFIAIPLLVAILGVVIYFVASNPKWQEVGRILFWTGILAFWLGGGVGSLFHTPTPH